MFSDKENESNTGLGKTYTKKWFTKNGIKNCDGLYENTCANKKHFQQNET
jgi:hypothetical protein